MRTNQARLALHHSGDPLRACAHDLRNLFAVVASAKSLLEKPLDEHRKRIVMDGLARVAVEGKLVTDALLAGGEDGECGSNPAAELQSLATIFHTLERPGLQVDLSTDPAESWILVAPAELRAVVLELVTNAAAAGARRIQIRAGRRGCRYWLIVADDGSGFTPIAPEPARSAGLHGTGMRRLAAAARSAHGKVRIRSKSGNGSVIALILPILRILVSDASNPIPVVRSITGGKVERTHGQRSAV
jgi:anti-sigma regulatory factor (Ser/Thr protein kinase)